MRAVAVFLFEQSYDGIAQNAVALAVNEDDA